MVGGVGGTERWHYKGNKVTFEGDGYVHCSDCGDDFIVFITWWNFTLEICAVSCMSIIIP